MKTLFQRFFKAIGFARKSPATRLGGILTQGVDKERLAAVRDPLNAGYFSNLEPDFQAADRFCGLNPFEMESGV